MDLKVRFSLLFSLLISFLLAGFSGTVYVQVKNKLFAAAGQSLEAHVEHQWRHLEMNGGHVHEADEETLPTNDIYLRTWKNGSLIYDSFPPELIHKLGAKPAVTLNWPAEDRLIQYYKKQLDGDHYEIWGYSDLSANARYLSALARVLLLGCLLSALLIIPLSWAFTRSLLGPFRELARKTTELDARTLSFRFDEPPRLDEYGVLVRAFNSMLTGMDKSFKQVRRFATNASHELRTPLTVIRGEAELLLRRPREVSVYEEGLSSIVSQAGILQGIIGRLLFFSDVERIEQEGQKSEIDVGRAVSETVKSLLVVHDAKTKSVEIDGESVHYFGHRELCASVMSNLIENALKYSSSKIRVCFRKDASGLHFQVEDDGCGIPENRKAEVFLPFSQGTDRKRYPGHGLGLSIVNACVNAAKGKIDLSDSPLGGLQVSVWLPETV